MPTYDASQLFAAAPNVFHKLMLCPDKDMGMGNNFARMVAPLGLRYRAGLLTGDSRGEQVFNLKFTSLPATASNSLTLDDETTISKALYAKLFCDFHIANSRPFFVTQPLTLIDLLVDFTVNGYQMRRSPQNEFIWSLEMEVVEYESPNLVAMTDEFSGSGTNPQQI